MTFDWGQIGTVAGSFILGIGGVAAFLAKALPTVKKVLALASDTILLLNTITVSIEDDNLSPAEWDLLKANAIALRNDWQQFRSK